MAEQEPVIAAHLAPGGRPEAMAGAGDAMTLLDVLAEDRRASAAASQYDSGTPPGKSP